MRGVDRVVLAVQTAAAALAAVLAVLIAAGWQEPVWALAGALATVDGRLGLAATGALLFAVSARVAAAAFGSRRDPPVIVFPSPQGEVRVSLAAVEGLVQRLGRQVEGVRDLRVRVRRGEEGLELELGTRVSGDARLPELCERLQQTLSQRVQQVVGVPVGQVRVTVREIGGEPRRHRLE